MRISPLAICGHRLPALELAALAARDSTLSHPHPNCQAAVAVFAVTIARALTSALDGPELFEVARTFAAANALTRPVVAWLNDASTLPPAYDDEKQGWVRIAFTHAFFQLKHATSFEAALVQVVRSGGDTDTNGAITGALLGACFGLEAIPERWRARVTSCVPPRPPEYHCGDLLAVADALVS
jgi:ADP-ribosylglycohydrolase